MKVADEETKNIQTHICVNPEIKDAEGEIDFEEGFCPFPLYKKK